MLFDVAVLGAGAAGMMCAAVAGQRPARGPGGPRRAPGRENPHFRRGRCNFTNLGAGPANFLSENPHFCRSALAGYAAGFPGAAQAPSRPGTRSIAASCSATIPANPSSGCCASATRPGGLAHGLFGGRDRPRRAGLRAAHQPGPHPCGQAGRGHRRHGDPAAGRHRFRPEDRAPVRPENRRATARAGAADLRRGAMAAVVGAVRRGAGSEPVHGAGQGARRIPRRPAVHASRAVGAGDFADFQLLEAGRAHRGGPGAGP